MAELIAAGAALGVASSLITFTDVTWRILKRLDEYCNNTKDVPKVIKHIRPQLQLLIEKVEELRRGDEDGRLTGSSPSTLSKIIKPCEEQLNLLDQLTVKMLPSRSDSTILRLRKAGLSIYYEKELSRVWARVESYKTTFIFHFTNTASQPVPALVVPVSTHYHYPASVASHLVVREEPLRKIEDAFSRPNLIVQPQIVVLLEMGGCGKTQLALWYCQQSEANGLFSSIFWVDASSPTAVTQSFSAIAGIITENKADRQNFEANLRIVKDCLGTRTDRWLIVFDNFDDPTAFKSRDIKEYFPHGKNGAILVTSRHGDVRRLGETISVDEMSQNEGLELLFRQTSCDRNESNALVAREIITRLGNIALAIDQAGAYVSARRLPLHLFMDHFNKRREQVLKETPNNLWEYRKKLDDTEAETSLSVFTTWELSFQQIDRYESSGKTLKHLLSLSAFFNNTDIFEDLFRGYKTSRNPNWLKEFCHERTWDSFKFQDVLAQLVKLNDIDS